MKLGNHVRKFRFEHNEMTQQELANAVGVSRLTIHSIEKGKFTPSTLLALKISEYFSVKVEYLFFIDRSDESDKGDKNEAI